MFTTEELNEMLDTIKKEELRKKELEDKINQLKDSIKDYMRDQGVDEFITDRYVVRNKEITTNRFDTKRFKVEHTNLYEDYLVTTTSERFTVN